MSCYVETDKKTPAQKLMVPHLKSNQGFHSMTLGYRYVRGLFTIDTMMYCLLILFRGFSYITIRIHVCSEIYVFFRYICCETLSVWHNKNNVWNISYFLFVHINSYLDFARHFSVSNLFYNKSEIKVQSKCLLLTYFDSRTDIIVLLTSLKFFYIINKTYPCSF